ncbi:MAG: PspC domain-containing protein [Lachnospiraceae bacterium]|nr:PspC domain-containing protein [Lachnospiraceae bacterium]
MNNDKRLTKSASERMICGVCGGLAEYLGTDPTVIRILWVIFSMLGGSGVVAYIIAAVIMPEA